MSGLLQRIVVLVVCTVVAAGLAFGVIYVQGIPIRRAQEAAGRVLGDKASLCSAVVRKDIKTRTRVNFDGKIGIVDAFDGSLYEKYQDALPAERQPAKPDEVRGILCLFDKQSVFGTSKYGNPAKYFCTRFSKDLEGYLLDAETGKLITAHLFYGTDQSDCPETTDSSVTRYGDLPPPDEVAAWFG